MNSLLQDNSGGQSSMRVAFLAWALGILLVWGYISVSSKELKPIDNSVITIIGVMASAKVVQRFGEKPDVEDGNNKPS